MLIFVPDNIKIEKCCGGDDLGIVLNDEKKVLYYHKDIKDWVIVPSKNNFVKCKIVPVNRRDLKIGYTYYRTDMVNEDFSDLYLYCKYLGNGKYVYIANNGDIKVGGNQWKHWYQIVPIKGGIK